MEMGTQAGQRSMWLVREQGGFRIILTSSDLQLLRPDVFVQFSLSLEKRGEVDEDAESLRSWSAQAIRDPDK